jgi:hypothetical protein
MSWASPCRPKTSPHKVFSITYCRITTYCRSPRPPCLHRPRYRLTRVNSVLSFPKINTFDEICNTIQVCIQNLVKDARSPPVRVTRLSYHPLLEDGAGTHQDDTLTTVFRWSASHAREDLSRLIITQNAGCCVEVHQWPRRSWPWPVRLQWLRPS